MKINVFEYKDYKIFLTHVVKEGRWGAVGRLAEAAHCQRSYLSRVLNGNAHITLDHAHSLAAHIKLDANETEYFLLLVERDRASSKEYKKYLDTKLLNSKINQENIGKLVKRPNVEGGEKYSIYYSAWYYSAIHILVSIPGYKMPEKIAARLFLPIQLVEEVLRQLSDMKLVKKSGSQWETIYEIHVPKSTPLVILHHSNWRQRALLDSAIPSNGGLHFSSVQSFSREDYEKIKQRLVTFLESTNALIGPSPAEEIYSFNFDLFQV